MRIVLHGQQAFGKAVLEKLLERGENVVAVCTAPAKEGRAEDPLAQLAREKALPLHQPASWRTPEAAELMRSFDADICMMAYVLLFVPQAVRDAPKFGTFQFHPSLCPLHRGPSSINWPIAMGSTQTGLTIFWPDDKMDEGPILLQKTCAIGADETLGDVYFKKLFPMGVDAMLESLDLVKAGIILKHDQRIDQGSYESWFKKEDARIDWAAPIDQLYNIIRAANPAPGAWTSFNGETIQIYDCVKLQEDGVPGEGLAGEIVALSQEGITVQANRGRIQIIRLRSADGKKQSSMQWADKVGLSIGDKFGS